MRKRMDIILDPRSHNPISLWEPEEKDEMPFISFVEEIYQSFIQNNNSLEALLQNYYTRGLEIQYLQEKILALEDTVQTLKTKTEILENICERKIG